MGRYRIGQHLQNFSSAALEIKRAEIKSMVTKSTGVGRGGKRPGAGRKPKHALSAPKTERGVADAVRAVADAKLARVAARAAADLVEKAYATLEDVMDNSPYPAPRVSAARAVIDLAREEAAEKAGAGGKKALRQANAEKAAGSGRFAVPEPPRLMQ
ncbi:hypothetical protein [Hansschlegelia sp.]|uniref:hypothetical protein n=1 Tax=Hansschlegelia sp. TaxID=2041892 RepID=UPI002D0C3510|nr:hypothetical protein [Hansschlegelia sp.]HVI30453.1 hypothetical protein [Hansschlegelia sp.]